MPTIYAKRLTLGLLLYCWIAVGCNTSNDIQGSAKLSAEESVSQFGLYGPLVPAESEADWQDSLSTYLRLSVLAYDMVNAFDPRESYRSPHEGWEMELGRFALGGYAPLARTMESDETEDRFPGFIVKAPGKEGQYIVALHGTRSGRRSKRTEGWSTNADDAPLPVPLPDDSTITVHQGYYRKAQRLLPDIIAKLRAMNGGTLDNCQVTFTGHSQGAAIAHMLALLTKISYEEFKEPNKVRAYALSPAISVYGRESVLKMNEVMGEGAVVSHYSSLDPVANFRFDLGVVKTLAKMSVMQRPTLPGIHVVTPGWRDFLRGMASKDKKRSWVTKAFLGGISASHYSSHVQHGLEPKIPVRSTRYARVEKPFEH